MRVAFLGLGRMGRAMAHHVLPAGHELVVWNRTPGKGSDLVAAGAIEAASPSEAAREADAVVLMLFGPDAVREVLLGPDGVAAGARSGTLVVDSTTIGPSDAREFGAAAADRGLRYLDAPVAGSVGPATEGTLGVLVGGDEEAFAAAEPLLRLWGAPEKVRRVGDLGTGSAMKLVLNLTLGVAMAGVGDALRLAHDLGLERTAALDVLALGPFGWTIGQKRAMLEAADYSPTTFSLDLMAKDLDLAVSAAHGDLPAVAAALAAAREAVTAGHGDDDYTALAGYLAFEGHANSY